MPNNLPASNKETRAAVRLKTKKNVKRDLCRSLTDRQPLRIGFLHVGEKLASVHVAKKRVEPTQNVRIVEIDLFVVD